MDLFGEDYSVRCLPDDFISARIESIVCDAGVLIIGEYGKSGKRIAVVTEQSCVVNHFYGDDPLVAHIHSLLKTRDSDYVYVTTGDTAKYLDLWSLRDGEMMFRKRLKFSLAGYTAMIKIGSELLLGTDFTGRTNYVELLGSGSKIPFPNQMHGMHTIKFRQFKRRYLSCLSKRLDWLGGGFALSILDIEREEFVWCDLLKYQSPVLADRALHRTAIELRSHD